MQTRLALWSGLVLGILLLTCVPILALSQDERKPPPKNRAEFLVKVAPDARVTIDTSATTQTGAERHYYTPQIQPNVRYRYTFVATWMEKGKEMRVERVVRFQAGDRIEVDLRGKPAVPKTDRDKAKDKPKSDDKSKPKDKDKPKPDDKGKRKDKDKRKPKEGYEQLPPPRVEKSKPRTPDKDRDRSDSGAVKSRTFDFHYEATITGLKKGQQARIWIPVATTNVAQDVKLLRHEIVSETPTVGSFLTEKQYGNRICYIEADADHTGSIGLKFVYRVTRREVRGQLNPAIRENEALIRRFLQPDSLVPVTGKPLELIKGKELPSDPMQKARMLYDLVNNHMKYSKSSKGWGRGDSAWACDSKSGNCSDFHSLFISLARSQNLPSKFEIGFPIPTDATEGTIGGYHCWAFFRPEGKGWVPVDISEANKEPKLKDYYFGNLTPDRVTFSTGRDIDLVPTQAGKPVNFLVYPHVEVDGKVCGQEKIAKKFSFVDARVKK